MYTCCSSSYGVALVSRIDKITGLFRERGLQKRRYSAKETYHFNDPTDRSHPITPPPNQIYSRIWYAFSLFLRKFHSVNTFNVDTFNFCKPGRARFAEEKMQFPSRMSAKRILFYFQPNSNRFRTHSGAVHHERAEWTSLWHGLCSNTWNPPRMEVETLWVSTWKKDISFRNKFDWVEGVRLILIWDMTPLDLRYPPCAVKSHKPCILCYLSMHTATRCNTLQHTVTRCNTLQHAATRCNTLQLAATHRCETSSLCCDIACTNTY